MGKKLVEKLTYRTIKETVQKGKGSLFFIRGWNPQSLSNNQFTGDLVFTIID